MSDFRSMPVNKQFMRVLVKPDTWLLNGISLDNAAPHPHVVIGDKLAAIIDTTDLELELRKYVEENVTDKPLVVISTHSHGDHTANNYMFEDCPIYMSEISWEEIKANREKAASGDETHPGWSKGTYVPTIVKDGDIIDLGGRTLECIKFAGCHSDSSMVYLDSKYGCLFTGDEFEGGQVLVMGARGDNCIEKYHDNLLKLRERVNGRATCVCPPHNGSPCDIMILDYMIENCERIMNGIEGMKDVRSMTFGLNPHGYSISRMADENVRRSEWMGTSIVYNTKRIFYKDCE